MAYLPLLTVVSLNPVMVVVVLLEVVYFVGDSLNSLTLLLQLLLSFILSPQFAVLDLFDPVRLVLVVVFDFHIFLPVFEILFVELFDSF